MSTSSRAELEHNAVSNFCIEMEEHLHKGKCGKCDICNSFEDWLDN